MKKRLFTFGCSYVDWTWPTWADMLGRSYDFQNWAVRGSGNRAIAQRLSEAILSQKIGPGDLVIVQWTHFHRFDHHATGLTEFGNWSMSGNIHSCAVMIRWVLESWQEKSYAMYSLNEIHSAMALLESTGCEYYITSGPDLRKDYQHFDDLRIYDVLWEKYDWLEPIQEFTDSTGYKGTTLKRKIMNWTFNKLTPTTTTDPHPNPEHHLMWLERNLLDKLDIEFDRKFAEDAIAVYKTLTDWDTADGILKEQLGWTSRLNQRFLGL